MLALHLNENLLGSSPLASDVLSRYPHRFNAFPGEALDGLECRLAAHYGIDARAVVCGAGSGDVLRLVMQAFPAARFQFALPGHRPAVAQAQAAGLVACGIAPDAALDVDAAALLTPSSEDARTVIYVCSPDCHTGAVMDDEVLAAFFARADARTLFVVDQAYAEFAEGEERVLPSWVGTANVVLLRTFSKAYGLAGLRIGYGVCAPAFALRLKSVRAWQPVAMPALLAAGAALDDAEWLAHCRTLLQVSRAVLRDGLVEMGLTVRAGTTNFLLHRLPDAGTTVARLLAQRVCVATPGEGGEGWCRVTLGAAGVSEEYLRCLRRAIAN